MPPPGGTRTALAGMVGSLAQRAGAAWRAAFRPDATFSPAEPLVPVEPERTRLWDFPVGWNLAYTPRAYSPVSFAQLRALARAHDVTRLAIETRKDQVEALSGQVAPIDPEDVAADAPRRIAAMTAFWESPDGEQPFASWMREYFEDVLVLDAPALEIRRNRGGGIIGLDIVDGATIKLLIDDTGRRPKPPAPAYEQVIHGRPWRLLTTDDLLYMPRNRRPDDVYGFGPVEQILTTVNTALRRQVQQLQFFTDGNIPAGLMNAPPDWTVEQIRQFQEWFDSVLAGNTAERSKIMWGPAGTKYVAFKPPPLQAEVDEWLTRIICFAFSLPPTAFIHQVNRAVADTSQETALSEGLAPLLGYSKRFIDHVIQYRFGHKDLQWVWGDLNPVDSLEQMNVLTGYVNAGIYKVNEAREILGQDPDPAGDVLTVKTGTGPVPLAQAIAPPGPQPGIAPPQDVQPPGAAPEEQEQEGAAEKAARPFWPSAQGAGERSDRPARATPRSRRPATGGRWIGGASRSVLRPRRRPDRGPPRAYPAAASADPGEPYP